MATKTGRRPQPYDLKTASCVAFAAHVGVGHNAQMTEAVWADVIAFVKATLLK